MQGRGTFIALAWPNTQVVKEGKWYDMPMKWLGFVKNGYYKVGHAALLIIDHENGMVNYFDFGRYHTPLKMGRVRDKETDPDLCINTIALFSQQGAILNIDDILNEVADNESNHGEGEMLASLHKGINHNKVMAYAKQMQSKGVIAYGPLVWGGTNCSRFVGRVAREATSNMVISFLLNFPYTFSQTPKSAVRIVALSSGKILRVKKGSPSMVENNIQKEILTSAPVFNNSNQY